LRQRNDTKEHLCIDYHIPTGWWSKNRHRGRYCCSSFSHDYLHRSILDCFYISIL